MPNDGKVMLAARGLSFGYSPGASVIRGVDLEVRSGELLVLVGPNGAGKSTLLRLLTGLLRSATGEVRLEDAPLGSYRLVERARRIAFLPQHPQAPPELTAEEIVRLGRHPYLGLSLFESPDDLAASREALRVTGTLAFAGRPIGTLSGGEAQRVHLAAALAQEPRVLALDEPTSDLDLAQQLRIFGLLRELTRRAGLAVMVVSHDLNLAGRFADRMVLLHEGTVVLAGTPGEVLSSPKLAAVYGVEFDRFEAAPGAAPVIFAHAPLLPEGGG